MQIEVIERDNSMVVLPPEQTDEELEQICHRALAESARGLSVDERYVLHRLACMVADDPKSGTSRAGYLITLPVVDFATSAGITFKVARRRLDHAVQALFARTVDVRFSDRGTIFCWAESTRSSDDCFEVRFSAFFLNYLRQVAATSNGGPPGLNAFSAAVNAPAVSARGFRIPADLSIILVSRLKAHRGRPVGMSRDQLYLRVEKRLKRVMSRDSLLDVMEALYAKGPVQSRHEHVKYTHRDVDRLYDWVMENRNKPDFLQI